LRAFQELPALLLEIGSNAKELVRGVEVTSRQAQDILHGLDTELGMLADDSQMNRLSAPEAPSHSVE